MKTTTISILLALCLLQAGTGLAQVTDVLTLEQAIALALANNHDLKIQQHQVSIAQNNVYPGNAGLVPTIRLVGNASYQNNNTDVLIRTFADNPPTIAISDGAAASTNYTAAIEANYVLLGGFGGQYRLQLLGHQKDLAFYQQQAVLQATIMNVASLFLEVAKLQNQEELLRKNVAIGQERLQKVEDRFQFGKVTGLAVLQAKTDLNQDRTALDQVQVAINNLKRDLNFLVGLQAETSYRVVVTYTLPPTETTDALKAAVVANNPEIHLSKVGVQLANAQYKLTNTQQLPAVNAFVNYGYLNQTNDVQQLAELQTVGYTLGVGVSYNLFAGGRAKRNSQGAKLQQEVSQYTQQQTEDRILANAIKEQNNLNLLQQQLLRQQENIITFRESYARAEERFYNGKVSSLDLRNAQTALLNAEITITNLKADILKTAFRLKALKGQLLAQ